MSNTDCTGCVHWIPPECHRYPPGHRGYPVSSRGCGEYAAAHEPEPEVTIEEVAPWPAEVKKRRGRKPRESK